MAKQQFKNISEVTGYLSQFYENTQTKYSLTNMRQMMTALDNPQDKFKAVHIAGTSGKTSTAYYMSALLTADGTKTGLTVSPHVDSLTERIQIKGQALSQAEFCQSFSQFTQQIADVSVKLSWFELIIGFAYWYFAREQVDYAVVEVGLGGLLDATNVISRSDKLCLITDIGLDHTSILGHNLTDIATQKIGIVQPHNLVLTNKQPPEVLNVFDKWVHKQCTELRIIDDELQQDQTIPAYQAHNWQLAYGAYKVLAERDQLSNLTRQALAISQHISIPGRMDVRQIAGKTVVMDGAHNAQKMSAFLDSLKQLYPDSKPAVLLALKDGKEYQDIVPLLAEVGQLIITSFETSQDTPIKSMNPDVLGQAFASIGQPVQIIGNPDEALATLLDSSHSLLVITGSFYLLSQIRNNKLLNE